MKRIILYVLVVASLLSGCGLTSDEGVYEVANPRADEPVHCSEENPPQIYKQRTSSHEYTALDYCGIKTTYSAIELKDDNLILFSDANIIIHGHSSEEANDTNIKTISTLPPFDIQYIGKIPGFYYIPTTQNSELVSHVNGWYVIFRDYGEFCGDSYYLFAVSPMTRKFILGGNSDGCGRSPLEFISNSGEFTARDLKFVSEISDGLKDSSKYVAYGDLCGPLGYDNTSIGRDFIDGYPDKVYCYKEFSIWEILHPKEQMIDDPIGYFDLLNDRFVYLKRE